MAISRLVPSAWRCIRGLVAVATVLSLSSPTRAGSHPGGGGGFHGGGGFGGAYHGAGYGRGSFGSGYGGRGWFGGNVRALAGGYSRAWYGGSPYYCSGGFWYRPWNGWYLGCYPPIGLWIDTLPLGCDPFWADGVHYYTNQDVYYTDAASGGYTVTAPPYGLDASPTPSRPIPGSPDALALDALRIVPEKGQDATKAKADREDAQRYAEQKSGYDPADSDPEDPGTPRARRAYFPALRTYLADRGYSVK